MITDNWLDNFDINVESATDGGAIKTTHMIAFQEETEHTALLYTHTNVERTKSRRLKIKNLNFGRLAINIKQEPPVFSQTDKLQVHKVVSPFCMNYLIWVTIRKQNVFDQVIPSYSGWNIQLGKKSCSKARKTTERYLPTITAKVTDFKAIHQYMEYCQYLSSEINVPYTNTTLDVGTVISAFKYLWSNNETFSNVVIHLGDFHIMKENFQVNIFWVCFRD